jgi:ATP-dependent HslUV protease subunit HslV
VIAGLCRNPVDGIHFRLFSSLEATLSERPVFTGTTVLAVRRGGRVAIAGDGQVTLDRAVVKHGARKVRRLSGGSVLAGFAGSAADAFALLTRFEEKLTEHSGQIERASVELVRDWRTDRALRRLEAMLVVADAKRTFLLSGTGDLIEPDDGVLGIGSGSVAAVAAARALVTHTDLGPRQIAEEAMKIAAGLDLYTNDALTVEEL